MIRTIGTPGFPLSEGQEAILLTNRTGATSVLGGTCAIDLPQADGDSTTLRLGLSNVVAASTALMAVGFIGLWATAGVADNADGRVIFGHGVLCQANVDSTTDIAKGDALKCVNAGDHLVKATPGTDRYHAIALEARTANTEGPIWVMLFSAGLF
jgi:hypothetical protein